MISRRAFITAMSAAGLTGCARGGRPLVASSVAAAGARAIYESVFEQMLQLEPETATSLGLDTGPRAALKSRLRDLSVTDRNGWWAPVIALLPRLRAIDRESLPLRERALRD